MNSVRQPVEGFGFRGSRFRVSGLGFGVRGFRGLGFWGLQSPVSISSELVLSCLKILGSGPMPTSDENCRATKQDAGCPE